MKTSFTPLNLNGHVIQTSFTYKNFNETFKKSYRSLLKYERTERLISFVRFFFKENATEALQGLNFHYV